MRRFFYVCAGGLSLRKKRLELINMYLPKNIKGRLLEVGCGDGFGLARIRKAGWEVEGQEIDPNAAKNAQNTFGLHIHLGKLEDVALPDASYDAITMVHVIEHVYDPLSLFEECYRILKPGGTLVCITPNIESFGHKHFKSFWLHLDPPRHLRLFSPKCMEKFINKLSFCQHNIITTPAGAERTYSDSMDIQRTGKVRLIEQFKWKKAFQAMIFQQRALAMNKKDSISGEEIVVRLVK